MEYILLLLRVGSALSEGFYEVKTATLSARSATICTEEFKKLVKWYQVHCHRLFGGQMSGSRTASEYSMITGAGTTAIPDYMEDATTVVEKCICVKPSQCISMK